MIPYLVVRIFDPRDLWGFRPPPLQSLPDFLASDKWHRQYCTSPPVLCSHHYPRRIV